jgi:cell wall-associated NlpC family hydrolase
MREFDIYLRRSSRDMAANNGFKVDRSELLPGDLVFFNTNGRNISHVGIYIGDDKFIHSASRGVVISGMGETYWRSRFVRANRVM